MKVMKAWALSLSLACAALASQPAHAVQEVAGVKFEDWYSLAGQQLQLNGAGLRKMMIIKVYAVGLYVPHRDGNFNALLTQAGPKSIHVVLLRDVDASRLTDALISGVEANSTSAELAVLKSRLDDMAANLRKTGEAREGAVVKIEFVPNQGTTVISDGRVVIKDIPGEDFFRGLMKIWLGEHPADKDLKGHLLGAN
ncbi:MAG: chalcone isomerase family protein [Acidobacteriota bacterium]